MPDKRQTGREANEELRKKRGSAQGYGEAPGIEIERMRATQGAGVSVWSREKAKDQKSAEGAVEREMEELKRQRAEHEEDQP